MRRELGLDVRHQVAVRAADGPATARGAIFGNAAAARCCGVIQPSVTSPSSTNAQRACSAARWSPGRTAAGRAEDRRRAPRPASGVRLCTFGAEVRAGGGLHAVRAATEVDGVQVVLQDLVLRQLLLDLDADDELVDLARQRPLLGQVVVLHQLLGDGRAALQRPAAQVVPGRAQDAGRREAAVLVELPVLRRQHRALQADRDLRQRHRLPVGLAEAAEHGLAVGEVHDRGLLRGPGRSAWARRSARTARRTPRRPARSRRRRASSHCRHEGRKRRTPARPRRG